MKIKFAASAAAVAFAFVAQAAYAEDAPTPEITITGSAAVVSQYRFRGISQSDNKPAVQAAITIADKSGFYVSFWGSSASAGNSPVNIGGTEIDVYGGYTHALGKSGITFDGGLYGYIYPGASAGNYFEVYGSLTKSFGPITAKVGANWAPKQHYFTATPTPTKYNMYEYAELSYGAGPITLHSHLGHTGGGFNYFAGGTYGGHEFIDYTVGASYKWKALTFDASLVGTNVGHKVDVDLGTGDSTFYRLGKPVAVVSLTASF